MTFFNEYLIDSGIDTPVGELRFEFINKDSWESFYQFIKYFKGGPRNRGIKRDIAKAQRDFLERYKRILIGALVTEGRSIGKPFAPHKPSYKSPTGKIGDRTGNYLNALKAIRIQQKDYEVSLSIPLSHSMSHSYGKATLNEYAFFFEFGAGYQVPRPFWRPSLERMGGFSKLGQYINGAVGKRLRKMGINVDIRG